ncbi:piggyBac transposable element-derived protein 4 [Ixodes scapularis]|uniref:piggyBac transposable element-derived protein 4 n=1 Tax=Ixodes scapularis TaxID=6945 RepID=UPI001A9CBB78|nr:piggyBac transposable element-derived protein 4 [Ixodes scapularis]
MAPPTFHPKAFYKHGGKNLLYLFLFSGLLWSPSLTKEVVFQTNLYAQQAGKPYTPTTEQEMRSFLGLNLLMGIKRSPSYRDYWSSVPDLHDPFISKIMTVNRFGWLLSYLHLNDNVLQPPRAHPDFDRLYKEFPKAVHAEKPVKRGYKVWMLCASTGYNLKFEIYSGRSESGVQKELGAQVVKKLCQDISGRHHRVFFDNYFTSYGLLKDLREQGIYACGTVNHNRKHLPKLQADKEMERGNTDWSVSDESVCCMKWKDKRTVHLLSNFHDLTQEAEVDRKNKDGTVTKVPCPAALYDYNKNMNFVDKFDQMKGQYEIDRKSTKWWHRIFFPFLDCCVVNAYIIFREIEEAERMTMKDFRHSVISSLTAEAQVASKAKRRSSTDAAVQLKKSKPRVDTNVRLTESKHQPKRCTHPRCARCSTKTKPSRTTWMCETCDVPLCLRKEKNCFSDCHKK